MGRGHKLSLIHICITNLAVAFVPVLLGIILHEVAHGWAASLCGDHTARMLGRLTLNPVPHIDPMGLAMFVLTALASPFVFGWAKPVPVNPRNMRNPERGMLLVSVAGPLANMLLAFVCAGGAALMWRYAQTCLLYTSNTALHDGAVIIDKNGRIAAAGCVLPLAAVERQHFGTRHRAALGVTEVSDAVAPVSYTHLTENHCR